MDSRQLLTWKGSGKISVVVEGRHKVVQRFADAGDEDCVIGEKVPHARLIETHVVCEEVVVSGTKRVRSVVRDPV